MSADHIPSEGSVSEEKTGDQAPSASPAALRYKPLRLRTNSNLGQVLIGEDENLHREVALQRIPQGPAADTESRRRCLHEAEIVGRLEHAGIVPLYGLGQDTHGRPCYAMRFVQGESLQDAIDNYHIAEAHGRNPREQRRALRQLLGSFVTACKTMAYAHSQGVIHCDLKPAHIMLGPYGQTLVVDWGRARSSEEDATAALPQEASLASSPAGAAGELEVGSVVSAPAYCSPELLAGRWEEVGPASDIFSLGATLYYLLTNELPYHGAEVSRIIAQASAGQVIPPRQHDWNVPRALEAICLKAMDHKPERRYPTALALAEDVECWLADEPVAAYPERRKERLVRTGRRHPGAVTLMIVLGAIAATSIIGWVKYGEETQRQRAEERSTFVRVTNGEALLDQGDPYGALLWFAQALAEEKRGSNHEEAHRVRLAAMLARCPRLTHVWQHEGSVRSVEFSRDGRRVVSASDDQTARIWDVTGDTPTPPPLKHKGRVLHASFSLDGSRVVTACEDDTAQVWDAVGGVAVGPPLKHEGPVAHAWFSPDGRRVVTASGDKTARVWDAASGQPITPPLRHINPVEDAKLSPDGRRVVTASGNQARVWDAASGKPVTAPLKHNSRVICASFSADGARVLVASEDETQVWDASTGQPVTPAIKHEKKQTHATFSADGRRVFTGSHDGMGRIWDVAGGHPVGPPMKLGGQLLHASSSPDGRRLVTACGSNFFPGEARVWDATNGQPLTLPMRHPGFVLHASFSPGGQSIVTACADHTVCIWEPASEQALGLVLKHNISVMQPTFSPDGKRVLTASDKEVKVWDAATGQPLTPPLKHDRPASQASFSPNGRQVLTVSANEARVWDAATGQPVTAPLSHKGRVKHATFSPDGRRLVTVSSDATAQVWDATTGLAVTPPLRAQAVVYDATFSPDGRRVITACSSQKVQAWNATTGAAIGSLVTLNEAVRFRPTNAQRSPPVAPQGHNPWQLDKSSLSPDGHRLVTVRWSEAQLWDPASGQPVARPLKHHGDVLHAEFSSDGRRIVTGGIHWGAGGEARVWDAVSGEPVTPPLKQRGRVEAASFSADGRFVVTVSEEEARVWDATSGLLLIPPLKHPAGMKQAALSPDGRRVITTGPKTAQVWHLIPDGRPAADFVPLAELLAGYRLDAQGGLNRLDLDTWLSVWDNLGQNPAPFAPSPKVIRARQREEAAACVGAHLWEAALRHLDPVIEAEPGNAWFRSSRGQAHAALGHWTKAETDFRKSLELKADVGVTGWHLLCLARAGAWDEHRKVCAQLLERPELADDSEAANVVAWFCVRFGEGSVNPTRPLKLLEPAVAVTPADFKTLGAALYRAGRYADAIGKLEGGMDLQGSGGTAADWLFLALAHQKLNHAEEAKKWLSKAQQSRLKEENAEGENLAWDQRVEMQLLHAEAEAVIGKAP
jgi:WD40 repeat protein/tetratricopeptide (TPR) repeat protein